MFIRERVRRPRLIREFGQFKRLLAVGSDERKPKKSR